ncbi:hypothetical protein GGD63_006957 [Bradyrhizobium sp. cir1]|uniref:hypothetical protein n=1 Tax=Bradyrhizobium sp. cir1 TaxID=1445730 RepID=UPI001605FB03|nr:hypothetical protein [Bradyrhizobium sp. cir1]MBB4374128.1 hypothetical protein [Bradyrhizobium sp. cir1]
MEDLEDFSDERHKAWCIHCGKALHATTTNKDHVPSKSLLDRPYPGNLPLVRICTACNSGFSDSEQYLVAFLGSVLCGTTNPSLHEDSAARRILSWSSQLRETIEKSKREYRTHGGETRIVWSPDHARISKALTKNARGHIYHELGEPVFGEPTSIWTKPLEYFTPTEPNEFEASDLPDVWPEVGSRLMNRLPSGEDMDGSWIVVQSGVYRFNVNIAQPLGIRIILREYLAAEITW